MNTLTPCDPARQAGSSVLSPAAVKLAPKRVVPDPSRKKIQPKERKHAIVPPPRDLERDDDEDNVIGEVERPRSPSEKPQAP
ncbi:MAG: hypothetical protein JWR60_4117 [Polaromonas sp.]|nr:hypothetical protein [Polaromonas sp.]